MSETIDVVLDMGLAALALGQNYFLHKHKVNEEVLIHEKEIKLECSMHQKEAKQAKQTYLLDALAEIERHFQQLNADLISTSREAERDMFDQRSQQFQTMIIAGTIMLVAIVGVLIQGSLPDEETGVIYIAYSISNSASLGFLSLSIVLGMEVVTKASSFMYRRSKFYNTELRKAIINTRQMMEQIRGENVLDKLQQDSCGSLMSGPDAKSDDVIIDEKWRGHEHKVANIMETRGRIHDKMAAFLTGFDAENHSIVSLRFDTFWKVYCTPHANLNILTFYVGTMLFITATVIFMWVNFISNFNSFISSLIAVVILGVSGFAGLGIVLYMRQVDQTLISGNLAETLASRRSLEDLLSFSSGNINLGSSASFFKPRCNDELAKEQSDDSSAEDIGLDLETGVSLGSSKRPDNRPAVQTEDIYPQSVKDTEYISGNSPMRKSYNPDTPMASGSSKLSQSNKEDSTKSVEALRLAFQSKKLTSADFKALKSAKINSYQSTPSTAMSLGTASPASVTGTPTFGTLNSAINRTISGINSTVRGTPSTATTLSTAKSTDSAHSDRRRYRRGSSNVNELWMMTPQSQSQVVDENKSK